MAEFTCLRAWHRARHDPTLSKSLTPQFGRLGLKKGQTVERKMTNSVANIVQKLRNAGFNINALASSPLWQVDGRGNMSTGQPIDLASKLDLRGR